MDEKVKLIFYGAGQEVGRSAIEVRAGKDRLMLDCGIKASRWYNEYPEIKNLKGIQKIFITHPHLDHTGALAYAYERGFKGTVVCPEITRLITEILLCDAYKIERKKEGIAKFSLESVGYVLNLCRDERTGRVGDIFFSLMPAGHVPGSVCVYLKYKEKSILYTGDINTNDTRLMNGNSLLPEAQTLIVDCTYGGRMHNLRQKTESDFKALVYRALKKGGSVLIPTFAIARTQEIMLLLYEMQPDCPIYLDGMGQDMTDIILRYQHLLKDKRLVEASRWIKRVRNRHMQLQIRDKQGIFITSGGMLNGGSYINYIGKIMNSRNSIIILPGYQAEGTPGHQLINYGAYSLRGKDIIVKCQVFNFNFSSHADFKGICQIIAQVKPKYLIAQHGDQESVESVKQYALSIGIKGIAPKNGDTFSF